MEMRNGEMECKSRSGVVRMEIGWSVIGDHSQDIN